MGGLVVPPVFDSLPFDLEIMYGELDGTFPNHPADPIQPENLRDLQARVLETGADVGPRLRRRRRPRLPRRRPGRAAVGVDDHGDRGQGHPREAPGRDDALQPDLLQGRARGHRRERRHAGAHAGRATRSSRRSWPRPAPCSAASTRRTTTSATTSGPTRAASPPSSSSSRSAGPAYRCRRCASRSTATRRPARSTRPSTTPPRSSSGWRRPTPAPRRIGVDGLTVDLGDWWFNLRPSNTEPLLRLNLEAPTREACDAHVAEVRALITDKG